MVIILPPPPIESAKKPLFSKRLHTLRNWDHSFFISFWLLYGLYIAIALGVYNGTRASPELFKPPWNPNIKAGTTLPLATAIIGLVWFAVTLIPHWGGWYKVRVYYLVLLLFRGFCTVLVAITVGIQAAYLPRPLGTCKGSWAMGWAIPDTGPIFGKHRHGPGMYLNACQMHVMIAWRFELALMGWMALTTLSAGIIWAKFERIQR